jgi:MFS family permease
MADKREFSSLSKESATQPADFDPKQRWLAVPPANLVHLSIGGVYAYSMWTHGMTNALGVVSSAPLDWNHSDVLPVFSAAAVTLGLTTGTLGSWVEKVGPRKAGFVGALFWSSGLATTAAGVHIHSLPLVYLGYGFLGGIGWGMMYLSPVTTVMKWFPDRRGLATGIALSAFGAGAAIAPTIIHSLIDMFAVAPEFVGPLAAMQGTGISSDQCVTLSTLADGSQVISESSKLGTPGDAVVVATDSDVSKFQNLETGSGVYKLGTGDTGVAPALATMGAVYGVMGVLGSRFMTIPHSDWTPNSAASKEETEDQIDDPASKRNDVGLPASYVTSSTTQFPLLWLSVFGNATGGLGLLSSSKLMITDIWTGAAPSIVTSSFATGYVSTLGIGMALGRFGWSSLSDYLGRKNTYALFGLGIPVVGLAPVLTHSAVMASQDGLDILPMLSLFYGGSVLAITFYGGLFSTLPAYIADLFGQKHSGAIHGKLLTAWAASAVVGPLGLAYMRSRAVESAIADLLDSVQDTNLFQNTFGCALGDTDTIQTLIDAKTITIARLLEVTPADTLDPTPFLYDSTCYAAAGLMTLSFCANMFIRPLNYVKIVEELDTKQ